jgi:hypothetical protein
MPAKKYLVTLTPEERQQLSRLTSSGKAAALVLTRARILLKADQASGGPAWEDATSASDSASSRTASTRRCSANSRTAPAGPASSTAAPRPA